MNDALHFNVTQLAEPQARSKGGAHWQTSTKNGMPVSTSSI